MGAGSWPQVVADLDRVEVGEFLPPGREFVPERVLHLRWKSDRVMQEKALELQPDGDTVLVRTPDQPDEVMRAPARLWEIANLPIETYRSRLLLPGEEDFPAKITKFQLLAGDTQVLVEKKPGRNAPRIHQGTGEQSLRLQSGLSALYGASGLGLLRESEVEESGLAAPRLEARLTADGTEHVLRVGAEVAWEGRRAFYCSLKPRFEGLIVIIDGQRLADLLELAP